MTKQILNFLKINNLPTWLLSIPIAISLLSFTGDRPDLKEADYEHAIRRNYLANKKPASPHFDSDPIRFTLRVDRKQVSLGDEVTLTITAHYVNVSPALLFLAEGSNAFRLKLLLPDGFVQTGGNYSDYVGTDLSSARATVTYTLKGYFTKVESKSEFRLLRGSGDANENSLFIEKAKLSLSVDDHTDQNKNGRLASNCDFTEGQFLLNWYGEQIYAHYYNGVLFASYQDPSQGFKPQSWMQATGFDANKVGCFAVNDPHTSTSTTPTTNPPVIPPSGTCSVSSPNAAFDFADCNGIGGWALDQANMNQPVLIDIYVDGVKTYAGITANGDRQDLVGAFGNSAARYHGFSYSFPANAPWKNSQNHTISVRICGVNNEIGGSPKTVSGCTGGTTTPTTPTTNPPTTNCGFTEGQFLLSWYGEQIYAHYYNGVLYASYQDPTLGFKPQSWLQSTGFDASKLSCFATSDPHTTTPTTPTTNPPVDPQTSTCSVSSPNAAFDFADCNGIGGWALDQANMNQPVLIDIYVDGVKTYAGITANGDRQDLVGAFGNSAARYHGFSYSFPANASWKNGQNHSISVRICGVNNEIGGSPKTISGCTGGTTTPTTPTTNPPTTNCGTGIGLTGLYSNNSDLSGKLVSIRNDAQINFNWGDSPIPGVVNADGFSIRWYGQIEAPVSGNYTFKTNNDDGTRLWVNGQRLINDWNGHGPTWQQGSIYLSAGQKYNITMDFVDFGGGAQAQLYWEFPGQSLQIIPSCRLYNKASSIEYSDPSSLAQYCTEVIVDIGSVTYYTSSCNGDVWGFFDHGTGTTGGTGETGGTGWTGGGIGDSGGGVSTPGGPTTTNEPYLAESTNEQIFRSKFYPDMATKGISFNSDEKATLEQFPELKDNIRAYVNQYGSKPDGSKTFVLSDEDQLRFPKFTQFMKQLPKFLSDNPRVMNALLKYTGLSKSAIINNLVKFGSGPRINLVADLRSPKGDQILGLCDCADFGQKPQDFKISIKEEYVRAFEIDNSNSSRFKATAFLLAVTILHESIHYSRSASPTLNDFPSDFGDAWEVDSFGIDIELYNADQRSYLLKQIR